MINKIIPVSIALVLTRDLIKGGKPFKGGYLLRNQGIYILSSCTRIHFQNDTIQSVPIHICHTLCQ